MEQLSGPTDEAVHYALQQASDTDPASLRLFLQAFVAALPANSAEHLHMLGFDDKPSSDEVIIELLQHRYMRLIGDAILPSATLVKSTLPSASISSERTQAFPIATLGHPGSSQARFATRYLAEVPGDVDWPIRERTEAQPMGP